MTESTSKGSEILIPVGAGELLDKLTILAIKSERISDAGKLANVRTEREALQAIADRELPASDALTELTTKLKAANEALWQIEDHICVLEASQDFGDEFVQVARSVYVTNDKRAALKKQINALCGSGIVEEKSYEEY